MQVPVRVPRLQDFAVNRVFMRPGNRMYVTFLSL